MARAPGEALADFSIFKLVAEYWGCGRMFDRWTDPEAVFQLLKELSRGQPCDITGIRDYQMLDEAGGIQWPFPDFALRTGAPASRVGSAFAQHRRLFEDFRFFHEDGKARFVYDQPRTMPEPPSEKYPLLLLTGRGTASQCHTQTRTG